MRVIISIVLLIAAVAVLLFWASDLWKDIQGLRLEKDAHESVIARMNQLRKTRDDLLASYNSIPPEDLRKINNFLPQTVNSGPLVVQMANMTNESGLLLKNINIGVLDERSAVVPVTLSVAGSFENFSGFLDRLEKSLRLIDVAKMSFTSGRENFYDFNLEANIHIQK